MNDDYPRNWLGYKNNSPKANWPEQARIAVNFVLNYEEGSERNILDGDSESESYLTDIPNLSSLKNKRHYSSESMFAYGSRAGCWRLLSLFDQNQIPITLFATGLALERNPALCDYLRKAKHEIAGHGYRWIDYRTADSEDECIDITKTLKAIKNLTGKEVVGWYTGRKSKNTRRLIVEHGLSYDSEDYSDDLPFWVDVKTTSHLVIPYTLDCNDCRYVSSPGWSTPEDFFQYLKHSFDYLYEEGRTSPKMMSIGLHSRLSGRPARAMAIKKFITYIQAHEKIWICRRQDIAKHWYNFHLSN